VKKKEKEKIYEKNVKTACKIAEGGKTNGFDSLGRLDTRFCS